MNPGPSAQKAGILPPYHSAALMGLICTMGKKTSEGRMVLKMKYLQFSADLMALKSNETDAANKVALQSTCSLAQKKKIRQ